MPQSPDARAPEPAIADPAHSGVHRGPLQPGEWVRLTDAKGRRHNIRLEPGGRFFTNRGSVEHDDLIGGPEGVAIASSSGSVTTGSSPSSSAPICCATSFA